MNSAHTHFANARFIKKQPWKYCKCSYDESAENLIYN